MEEQTDHGTEAEQVEGEQPSAALNGEGEATDAEQENGTAAEPQTADAPEPDESE